ncbi:class I poly(R)-hydroxyalkanoic acid synthase [Aquincola tertiaricarbonis]|uniref:class I poly(R)-hydroxyalkanoic acid synthase n=1 Tax=Aquincola tertiaricarbonis TaxID=391953 RepID=UPI0006152DF7|nr:class I poly(R)-hydroxyalkanoic acid synthase [Aquincola tertiaricarbonis]
MAKPTPTLPQPVEGAQAFGHALGEIWKSMSGLKLPADRINQVQSDYLKQATELWNDTLTRMNSGLATAAAAAGDAAANPAGTLAALRDRRFAATEWAKSPAAAYIAQTYLLNARTLMQMAEAVEGDAKTKARLRFAVQQWIDAAAPSNCLPLNPEALRKAIDSQGESIATGLRQLWNDVRQGHVSQTDESAFEVGRNVATSEGAVVYENEFFQLLEYKPLTAKVYERPMLFVPPCINKFYILDLQPENSLIRYSVEQGHRTFVMSWRNPDASLAAKTWDDYIEHGALAAIAAVQDITGADTFDMLGFCVGGTILSTALAVLAARGEQPAASLTLLTTLLDFSDTGVLDLFVDEAAVQLRELTLGEAAPAGPKLLKGQELATTFSFLRPNDLVWNYVVGNYLKGEAPPPFDLLYWNSDSTNLPGPMYCWYLRHTYLQDELKVPGKLTVCGEQIDLGRIEAPVYVYGSREDHIVPWTSAFQSLKILSGPKRFVLGASGHIAGVINPPAKKKRSHWIGSTDPVPASADDWFADAQEHPGSWWTDWSAWLAQHAGKQVAAPKSYGSRTHKVIEPAPGRYVKQKA